MGADPAGLTAWKADRLAALQAEDGWLNLTDRLEIPPGPQRVGAGADNDLVLSRGPAHLGVVDAGAGTFTPEGGTALAFQPAPGGFPQLRLPPFLLELHTVDGIPALRVRDLTLPREVVLRAFPYRPDWVIQARWEVLASPQAQAVAQKGGAETSVSLTHRAHFEREGRTITLLPTHWKDGKPMFVIRDATSGRETYAASRFLIGEVEGEVVTLDFNRAFTPPCGFTDFAICPLPPRENVLPFRVEAGEWAPEGVPHA